MKEMSADVAVVGAGIVGLAVALRKAELGNRVVLFEKDFRAVGASIRNFGLIWPVGQPAGPLHERAMHSRSKWLEVAEAAKIPIRTCGSVHLAHHADEWDVLQEFEAQYRSAGIAAELFSADQASQISSAIRTDGLYGGVFSPTECTVDPRAAIQNIPFWLEEEYGIRLRFGRQVLAAGTGFVETSHEHWKVDEVYICSGAEFQSLYPEVFRASGITRCKLQMMRTSPVPADLGPTLCGGLTLRHYGSFAGCASLDRVKARYTDENPEFDRWGIHVMMAQNADRELIIGDSHEYGLVLDPFDREEVNRLILDYLSTFAQVPDMQIAQRWNGTYPRLEGKTEFVACPETDVTIVNGLGGAGMTLSFGLAQEIC